MSGDAPANPLFHKSAFANLSREDKDELIRENLVKALMMLQRLMAMIEADKIKGADSEVTTTITW